MPEKIRSGVIDQDLGWLPADASTSGRLRHLIPPPLLVSRHRWTATNTIWAAGASNSLFVSPHVF